MSNKTELQANNVELQEILDSVNALPNAGGGSSIETVPVTIVDSDSLINTVGVSYTGVDDSGNPFLEYVNVTHNDWLGSIDVVKGTMLHIMDNSGDYKIGCVNYSGFEDVSDYDGNFLVCEVGNNACSITPSQIQIPNGDGSAIETCGLTIHAGVNGGIGTECLVPHVDDNGAIQLFGGYESIWGDHNLKVPKGSAFFLNYGFSIDNGADNIQSVDWFSQYNGMFYQITGDAEITITY